VQTESAFYSTPGPVTDLTRCPPEWLAGLPDTPAGLMKVVRNCVVDPATLTQIYKLPIPAGRDDERQIRTAAGMIERILQLDPSPITEARPPQRRFLGTCRNYATLTCALLRHTGTPARVRAGFAGYFVPNSWMDHWIIEYWRSSDERWVRVDPELDDDWLAKRAPNKTSELLAKQLYLSGGEAWLRCRRGELDPDRCNMGGDNWGIGEVRGSVLLDLAAINQDEMLPWDTWGPMVAAYKGETDAAYDELLDAVSEVTSGDDFDAIRELYGREDDLRVPDSLTNLAVG
jgi:transglutaminase superfamily protein